MKQKPRSVDGFVPTQRTAARSLHSGNSRRSTDRTVLHTAKAATSPAARHRHIASARDSARPLASPRHTTPEKAVPTAEPSSYSSRHQERQKKAPQPPARRRWLKRGIIALIIIIILAGGVYAFRALRSINNLGGGGGGLLGLFAKERLKADNYGRTNVLIFGTSPDGHDGADLADSIMVLSFNQDTGDAQTVSLPRDLYVKHSCRHYLGTSAGKLNESYICGKKDAQATGASVADAELAGQKALAQAAQEVLGLEVQYHVHANWRVLTDIVDAVGGIEVLMEAYDGSPMVYDPATNIRYRHGETARLNGERTLAFSRSRGAFGGTGFSGGNFDRERNQQKILKAIADKVKATNKTDIHTITNILEALGDNIHTNFQTSEFQTLASIGTALSPEKLTSVPLINATENLYLMKTDTINAASVVVPTAGTYTYGPIRAHVKKQLGLTATGGEIAEIVLLNGSGIAGRAAGQRQALTEEGLTIGAVGNADKVAHTQLYRTDSAAFPKTIDMLQKRYNTIAADMPEALAKQYPSAQIIVVLGP